MSLCQRGHHCLSRGKVIEERSVGDIGSLADLLDRRCSNALDQEQVERRLQNALIDLTLATIDPVHRIGVYGRASPGLSDSMRRRSSTRRWDLLVANWFRRAL